MDCRRAEELLSDHLDGTLAEPLRTELERHLAACAECGPLRAAMAEVTAALRALPLVDAPPGLAARVAVAALASARRPIDVAALPAVPPRMPLWLQAAAAVLVVAITGGVAYASRALGTPAHFGSRLAARTANAGDYLVERKERLVGDVRLLRAVVETAFEERLDRLGDRVDDYRRLLERRRALEQLDAERDGRRDPNGSESSRDFPNPRSTLRVDRCESADARGAAEGATT